MSGFTQVVVTVTPASAYARIVVTGHDVAGRKHVMADDSVEGAPRECLRMAVDAYHRYGADYVAAVANDGGDLLEMVLHSIDPAVPYRKVIITGRLPAGGRL